MKTDVELRHLRVFVAIVEAGSHTRAAKTLGISQSTVSETMSALERTVGVALFRKPPALTPAGDVLLQYARRIFAMTGELAAELAKVSAEVSATLVVAAVESLSAYVLPSPLAALRERWPNVRFEVITGTCPEIRERVGAGKCDVGLILEGEADGPDDSIVATSRFVIVGSTSHPLADKHATPDQLRRCDFYMCDASGNYHDVLRRYFEAAEVPIPRTQPMGTIEGVKRGISMESTALGLLPEHAVRSELAARSLVEITVRPPLPALVMRAIRSSADSPSPMVDELLGILHGMGLR
jgi:DNA-binding transcriptional LysR family regulator